MKRSTAIRKFKRICRKFIRVHRAHNGHENANAMARALRPYR